VSNLGGLVSVDVAPYSALGIEVGVVFDNGWEACRLVVGSSPAAVAYHLRKLANDIELGDPPAESRNACELHQRQSGVSMAAEPRDDVLLAALARVRAAWGAIVYDPPTGGQCIRAELVYEMRVALDELTGIVRSRANAD